MHGLSIFIKNTKMIIEIIIKRRCFNDLFGIILYSLHLSLDYHIRSHYLCPGVLSFLDCLDFLTVSTSGQSTPVTRIGSRLSHAVGPVNRGTCG